MPDVVKERPILFSGPMVRAILDGRKTQTRRVVKPQPIWVYDCSVPVLTTDADPNAAIRCPYGVPGDRLWVRETFGRQWRHGFIYRADVETPIPAGGWEPSIHMPRCASRIMLEVTRVCVERLQNISEADAQAEGIQVLPLQSVDDPSAWRQSGPGAHQARNARESFRLLWDSINSKRGFGWDVNPWVWVIEFRRVDYA